MRVFHLFKLTHRLPAALEVLDVSINEIGPRLEGLGRCAASHGN